MNDEEFYEYVYNLLETQTLLELNESLKLLYHADKYNTWLYCDENLKFHLVH